MTATTTITHYTIADRPKTQDEIAARSQSITNGLATNFSDDTPVAFAAEGMLQHLPTNGQLTIYDGAAFLPLFTPTSTEPTDDADPGEQGQVCYTATGFKLCVATDVWVEFIGTTF